MSETNDHSNLPNDELIAAEYALGVLAGMPQYVWSQHHNFHHMHNGNWDRYRGPYTTLSIDEYAAMTGAQQRMYRHKCSVGTAPVAGFVYLVFNPRFTWAKGSLALLAHIARGKFERPNVSVRQHAAGFETRYWKSRTEYWHMCGNNLALLGLWSVMCWAFGAALFFPIYLTSVSIAGGAGIHRGPRQRTHRRKSGRGYADDDLQLAGALDEALRDLLGLGAVELGRLAKNAEHGDAIAADLVVKVGQTIDR